MVPSEIEFPFFDDELYVSDDPIFAKHPDTRPAVLDIVRPLEIYIVDGDAHIGDQLYIPNKRTTL